MKESTDLTRKTEMVYLPGQVEISTKVIIVTMRGTEMARCSGLMAACTRENGVEVFNTVLVGWSFQTVHKKKDTFKIMSLSTLWLEMREATPRVWKVPMETILLTSISKWDLPRRVLASKLMLWTKIIRICSTNWQGTTIRHKVRRSVSRLPSRISIKTYLFQIYSPEIAEVNQLRSQTQECP